VEAATVTTGAVRVMAYVIKVVFDIRRIYAHS
jgi:hypothetical protein